jgi:beta-galactosidase
MNTGQLKVLLTLIAFEFSISYSLFGQQIRQEINLNGTWEFEQSTEAFCPKTFSRTIPVPGLIHLANPRINDYDKFFKTANEVETKWWHNLYDINYEPMYSWYRKKVYVDSTSFGREAMLTLRKSMYQTSVYVNGHEVGSSINCFTPIQMNASRFLKFGRENEILVRVGDRTWLSSAAAGGVDKEKERYLPGIWDDFMLSFTGKIRCDKVLFLPSAKNKKVLVKIQLRNFNPAQINYGDPMIDECKLRVTISEKYSGKRLVDSAFFAKSKRDNISEISIELPYDSTHMWSPENPFLYVGQISVETNGAVADQLTKTFGIRDFERKGRYFYLNDHRIVLRGANITLHRFFEDPEAKALAWDTAWVRKLLSDLPKKMNWNAMRISVGLVPDFWYDIADECGLLLQNEWMYWQNHGWDAQIRKEFTDWVWSDGCHPSIVIWDAINENKDEFIGNTLIPELKKLDPTRIWDNGYMTSKDLKVIDDMDEPHTYLCVPWASSQPGTKYKDAFELGRLAFWPEIYRPVIESSVPQLVNEYGWIWLWRDGRTSKLTKENFDYFVGEQATPEQRMHLQAYWMQLETEWLRSEPAVAGVLAFSYLTNNYGFTGDWFTGEIKNLTPGLSMKWLKHAFAPAAVFIDLVDQRFMKGQKAFKAGQQATFNLMAVNDNSSVSNGTLSIKLIQSSGRVVYHQSVSISIDPYTKKPLPYSMKMPAAEGGYVMFAAYTPNGQSEPVVSRRYIKVGKADANYNYYDVAAPF